MKYTQVQKAQAFEQSSSGYHQDIEYSTDNDGQAYPFNMLKSHTGRLKTERPP